MKVQQLVLWSDFDLVYNWEAALGLAWDHSLGLQKDKWLVILLGHL